MGPATPSAPSCRAAGRMIKLQPANFCDKDVARFERKGLAPRAFYTRVRDANQGSSFSKKALCKPVHCPTVKCSKAGQGDLTPKKSKAQNHPECLSVSERDRAAVGEVSGERGNTIGSPLRTPEG